MREEYSFHNAILFEAVLEAAKMQEEYKKLEKENKVTKQAICDLGIPYCNKYDLPDSQVLRIMRSEVTLPEFLRILGIRKFDVV